MVNLTNRYRPPPPPPLGSVLYLQHIIKYQKRKKWLTWYLLTLIMRQTIQIRNQISEENRELVNLMKEKMEQTLRDHSKVPWRKPCIYRVPQYLHENNKKSYFPQTVSVGPYHHGREHLLPMEHHKWQAVNMVLNRTHHTIEMYINAMKKLEEKARACYEGPIGLNSNEFVQMLVLDGCFVLELFIGAVNLIDFSQLGYLHDDPNFEIRGSMHSIRRDMIMLENQLPLFVLNQLIELQFGTEFLNQRFVTENRFGSVAQLAVRFFGPLMPTSQYWLKNITLIPFRQPIDPLPNWGEFHCLGVLRRTLLRRKKKPVLLDHWIRHFRVADKRVHQWIPCVTELRDAGFKFRKCNTGGFGDIRFNNGYLKIPMISIHDGTKLLFLNLIAFEQCHNDLGSDITSHVIVMDNLINTPEDVSYLHECGIIEHSLGSNSEVANMFNTLCQEVVFDIHNMYLIDKLREQVEEYKKQSYILKWNTWKRSLKQKYFENPWAYLSFFAAVLLLGLTFSQTYFAGYAYFKPLS